MRISQRSIEDVREAADIVEVASEFTALRRQGARFSGLCPYPDHQEKTPSFSVTSDKGFYYCFGCQRGGDAIKLLMDLKGLDFAEAVSYLADRSGVELQYEGGGDADAAKKQAGRRRAIYRALAAAAIYYHKYLLQSKTPEAEQARNYLKGRALALSTIGEFRLGYAPRGGSGFFQAVKKLGIERSSLDAAGLLSPRGGERFAGRITFPISDRRGRIVGFGARTLGDAQPKYLNSPETEIFNKRDLLYGFPQVAQTVNKERAAIIVEGYTDVLMLYQAGIKNAVATLGTATTPGHLRILSSYAANVYLLFDPDAAGQRAVVRAKDAARLSLSAAELNTALHVLSLSEDPADWMLQHDAQQFLQLLDTSIPILEFVGTLLAEEARGADVATRQRVLSQALEHLEEIGSRAPTVEREAKRRFADALQLSFQDLETLFRKWQRRKGTQERPPKRGNQPLEDVEGRERPLDIDMNTSAQERAGAEVLAFALTRPDLSAGPLREGIPIRALERPLTLHPDDFHNKTDAQIFDVLMDHASDSLDAVFSDERARSVMDRIGELSLYGEKLFPSKESVREAWLRLGILSRQRAMRDTPDYDRKGELQAQVQVLKEALRAVSS